jgi:hypothetical protein
MLGCVQCAVCKQPHLRTTKEPSIIVLCRTYVRASCSGPSIIVLCRTYVRASCSGLRTVRKQLCIGWDTAVRVLEGRMLRWSLSSATEESRLGTCGGAFVQQYSVRLSTAAESAVDLTSRPLPVWYSSTRACAVRSAGPSQQDPTGMQAALDSPSEQLAPAEPTTPTYNYNNYNRVDHSPNLPPEQPPPRAR